MIQLIFFVEPSCCALSFGEHNGNNALTFLVLVEQCSPKVLFFFFVLFFTYHMALPLRKLGGGIAAAADPD